MLYLAKEKWRWVRGYRGYYKVSSHGRVKSVDRIVVYSNGKRRHYKDQMLTLNRRRFPGGYSVVRCGLWKNRKLKIHPVYRLVLEAFVGPCPHGMECRHFPDRDPTNNRLDNLRWGTRKENMADMKIHGTSPIGSRHGKSKLSDSEVKDIISRLLKGERVVSIHRDYPKVNRVQIHQIQYKRHWKHIWEEVENAVLV